MGGIVSAFRILRAFWVMTREGVIAALPCEECSGFLRFGHKIALLLTRRGAREKTRHKRLAKSIISLGPSYVKLGQFLATRPDIVGHELANELAVLQDRMPPFDFSIAIATVEKCLGKPIDKLFVDFGEAVAAASIAQVHRARIQENEHLRDMAVKIIRPQIRHLFARDLQTYFFAARLQERYIPWLRRLKPVEIVQTLARTTRIEMDLRLEAAALAEFAEKNAEEKAVRVPRVDWERTGRDVLTMEWIEGIRINDFESLEKAGHDRKALAMVLMQSFLRQALRDGFFHADMHPGNLLVEADGTLVALDLGIMGRLGKKERRFLAEVLYGFILRDFKRIAQVHLEAGYVPEPYCVDSFAQALRAIGEPIHGQSAEKISIARLLTLLFEITEAFDMQTRPELLLLQKTMVVVEGVARNLDPFFDMWETARPVVGEWLKSNTGPCGIMDDVSENSQALAGLIRQTPELAKYLRLLPQRIGAALQDTSSLGFRGQDVAFRSGRRVQMCGCAALWLISLCFLYVVWKIL